MTLSGLEVFKASSSSTFTSCTLCFLVTLAKAEMFPGKACCVFFSCFFPCETNARTRFDDCLYETEAWRATERWNVLSMLAWFHFALISDVKWFCKALTNNVLLRDTWRDNTHKGPFLSLDEALIWYLFKTNNEVILQTGVGCVSIAW